MAMSGRVSRRWALAGLLATGALVGGSPAHALGPRGAVRVLLVLGGPGRDAEVARTVDTFVQGGFVRPERAIAVPHASQAAVGEGFKRARALAERFAPEEVFVVVVALGESPVRAADRGDGGDALALADGPLPLGTVTTLGRDIPAALHLVVSDVCERRDRPTELALGRPAGGPTWLRARSTCGAPSLATDWLTGLEAAADRNGDHRVTLGESYAYVAAQAAERGAVRSTGPFVDPASEVVLTHDAPPATEIALRRGRGITFRFFEHGHVEPFAEVRSLADRDVRVRVPATRLVVHALDERGRAGALELRMTSGSQRFLSAEEVRAEDPAVLAREGGALTRANHEVSVSYGAGAGGYASVAHGGTLRYAYASGPYALQLVGTAALAGNTNAANENLFTVFGPRLRAERRWLSGVPLLAVGVGVASEFAVQTLRRNDSARLLAAGYPTEERFRAAGAGPEVYASLRTTIGGTSFFGLELGGVFPVVRVGESLRMFPRAEGSLFAGLVY
jgi:hypothetical protein